MAVSTFPAATPKKGNGRRRGIPSFVLVDEWAYHGARSNASTAWSTTTDGLPISVSFRAAVPPALSHLAVHIPDHRQTTTADDVFTTARVLSADTGSGLFVLRVPRDHRQARSDYFVYRTRAPRPELHLLPALRRHAFGDNEVAVLSCNDDGDYVVAALTNSTYSERKFNLHLYRSSTTGGGCWTSTAMSVDDPVRDRVYPVPDSAQTTLAYHETTKVITIGGEKGTVGWVDLWRGILFCDVLSDKPELRDVPLPLPDRGSRRSFRNVDPHLFRDIAVDRRKNRIKYVEMVIGAGVDVPDFSSSDDDSYLRPYLLVLGGGWTAATYTMPIPVGSSWEDDWRRECSVRSADLDGLPVDDDKPKYCRLLTLRRLHVAHPALSVDDDDIVYMLAKGPGTSIWEGIRAVAAVDVRARTGQD